MSDDKVFLADSARPAKASAKRLRNANPDSPVEITVNIRSRGVPDANHLPQRALTPEQYAAQYGASEEDVQKVRNVLESYGIKVDGVSQATGSIRASGTVAAMEAAFSPNLGIYQSDDQGEYRGREGELSIPAELQGIVTGVFGLDQRRVARRRHVAASTHLKPLSSVDLEKRYNFPPGAAENQHIGIAEFGGGVFPDEVSKFCQKQGRPVPSVKIVPVNLQALTPAEISHLPAQQQKDAVEISVEVMMDIEIIAGLCSQGNISVYFATFDQKGWVDLLDKVIADRPVTLSVSWGAPEDSSDWSTAARKAINQRLAAAAAQGITICISSGDDGSGDELADGRAHVDFPSSSPFVLSVGGTMLVHHGNTTVEQTWHQGTGVRATGGGATGGGVSVFFARPQWQNVQVQSLNPGSIDGRIIPDVAALAGPPFYLLVLPDGTDNNGGTSASAPLWASLIARLNAKMPPDKQQRFLTPLLYQAGPNGKSRGTTCQDITMGNNTSSPQPGVGYQARPGFDAVTGWGTPNGTALLAVL
ncbi:MAG TPA: S53 family peptidase [Candidatus Angelobacter sp.]|jgi:kumamolisin|nr:S53 family peptidase [Candidatus Angelobacter sp.]